MRIVHVAPLYHPVIGGSESYIKELSERLANRGHDVTVLTQKCSDIFGFWSASDSALLPDNEMINGVKVKRFTPPNLILRFYRMRGSGRLLWTIGSDYLMSWARGPLMPRLIGDIVRSKPDLVAVINWYFPTVPYQVLFAKAIKRFPFVGIPLFHTEEDWASLKVQSKNLRHCDAVLVNTEYEGQYVNTLVPGKSEVHVVGVGVSPAEFAEPQGERIRARYGLGDLPVVGYVGKIMAHKGVGTLARAMKIVWRSNKHVRLVLAGPLGHTEVERRNEERLLGDLSAEERRRVIEIGPFADDDKASIFDAFDIYAMPSVGESFGIVYLEAWMCGKPVIGSRIGATRCVIREGIDGLLVDPHDPEAVAAAILDLVRHPEKRRRMGQAGYQKTLARFTWEKITDKVEGIYANVSRRGNMKSVASLTRPSITFQQVEKPEQKTTLL